MADSRQYVIWSFEHCQWWAPNHAGYTPHLSLAGLYTATEAGEIVTDSIMGDEVAIHQALANKRGAPTIDSLWHRCSLPLSIQEALNSGDGTYRP